MGMLRHLIWREYVRLFPTRLSGGMSSARTD